MISFNLVLRAIPWLVVLVLVIMLYFTKLNSQSAETTELRITSSTILTEMEALGKLELVRYNFKDITELDKKAPEYFYNLIKIGPDSRMALISAGSAVGCIDLAGMPESSIRLEGDTLYFHMPKAELCYYKLDMEQTRIYSLETSPLINKREFVQEGYKAAEQQIRTAAMQSGILEQTTRTAEGVLRPILERISGRTVIFVKNPANLDTTMGKY